MRRVVTIAGSLLGMAGFAATSPQGTPAPPADAAALRAARVAKDRAALEAESAAIDAFGHQAEFQAALERIHEQLPGGKWWPVADGAISMVTVENWLTWNRPAAGRTLPVALDLELDHHPFAAITDLSRQLHDHGIEFLFVCFPTRVQIDPALVVPGLATPLVAAIAAPDAAPPVGGDGAPPPFHGMVAVNTRFLLELSKAGVEVLNLAPQFVAERDGSADDPRRRLLYHRWNMHWSPRGAELAAKAIADRLAAMPWFKPGPYKEGRAFQVKRRDFPFQAEGNGQMPGAPPEKMAANGIQPLGPPLQKETKLHGPIVLLGDSFAQFHTDYSAAIFDQLFRFTGYPIDVIAPSGGAELACREALRRRGDGLAGKQVVIWLMQEAALVVAPDFRPVELFE